jgi:GMP synthase (glutamine-hydrolysing)
MTTNKQPDAIVVIDFGSQYTHLIARRIRELRVYSEIIPASADAQAISHLNARGIILSGGPASVYDGGAPAIQQWVIESGIPVLGICYGMQALVRQLGGTVVAGDVREYGHADLISDGVDTGLLAGVGSHAPVWMSHGDRVTGLPTEMTALARTANTDCAAITDGKRWFGLQFHPEVQHTPDGMTILGNFVHRICGCAESWTPGNFVADTVDRVRQQVGDDRVICGLSGGVDSSVAAALLHRAVGPQLTCIFVNNGLLRHGEVEQVQETFQRGLGLDLRYVDAESRFLTNLAGVTDPETKRKTIGGEFIRVFEDAAAEIDNVKWLAQGTLYPDVIESETLDNRASARIKTHHNVGGLPEHMDFGLVEPLRYLFKDEVRAVGLELGVPEEIIYRQPFPGPGLAIRIIGEVTPERVALLRDCDRIVLEEIDDAGLYRDIWQSFAVLTDNRTVGVMGDYRTYGYACAIRAVNSEDAMTADWVRLPYDVLARISNRIVNEVDGVNRVVYDITSKPPGTIEWE